MLSTCWQWMGQGSMTTQSTEWSKLEIFISVGPNSCISPEVLLRRIILLSCYRSAVVEIYFLGNFSTLSPMSRCEILAEETQAIFYMNCWLKIMSETDKLFIKPSFLSSWCTATVPGFPCSRVCLCDYTLASGMRLAY